MNSAQLVDFVNRTPGVTFSYRMLDHWIRQGLVRAEHCGGTGNPRSFDEQEARVVGAMARMVTVGITPATAAKAARGLDVGLGVQILVDQAVSAR